MALESTGAVSRCAIIEGHYTWTMFLRFVLISSQRPLVPGAVTSPASTPMFLMTFLTSRTRVPSAQGAVCKHTWCPGCNRAINNPMSCGCGCVSECVDIVLCCLSLYYLPVSHTQVHTHIQFAQTRQPSAFPLSSAFWCPPLFLLSSNLVSR